MDLHFTSFTPEWAYAFRKELAAGTPRRRAWFGTLREQLHMFLATAERERQRVCDSELEKRRLFVSELRSGVHALRSRFALDLAQMAKEYRAASDAYRGRTSGGAAASFHRTTWPTGQSGARSEEGESEFAATYDGRDATAGSKHSKKRHS